MKIECMKCGEMFDPKNEHECNGSKLQNHVNERSVIIKVRRLVRCVRALGLRLGWRYWRIENSALVNPWIALQWAERCENKADELRDINPELSANHRDWARQLRASHERYKWGKAPNIPRTYDSRE